MDENKIRPYKSTNMSKKKEVALMFDKIAHRYDFLNHFLSLNIDKIWRRKAVKSLSNTQPDAILDVACGTGDLAISLYKKYQPHTLTGIDISEQMLAYGRKKLAKKGLDSVIRLETGDSENINYPDKSFDAVTAAFGVRNFENLQTGINEMYRVLNKDGKIVILEFSQPQKFPIKQLYRFYFLRILPFVGKVFSKDNSAYTYLPESVGAFPYGEKFLEVLNKAGFKKTNAQTLSFGIASIYTGVK
jgi:demethylmenaquinone methyltransferase/2-methoxy-6-polyprenyl-1,4-benzoquinol methylase